MGNMDGDFENCDVICGYVSMKNHTDLKQNGLK